MTTASQNFQTFMRYHQTIAPLVIEMAQNVDFDEIVAEVLLESDGAPQNQVDLLLGQVDRYKEQFEFMRSQAPKR